MKKFIALAMASLMVLSMAACGGKSDAPAATEDPAATEAAVEAVGGEAPEAAPEAAAITTVNEGKLTVATSPDFAPYEFYAIADDNTPVLAGFDIALANYIGAELGLEVEIIPMDFDGVLTELATHHVDIGLAGLSPDPSRMDAMDFSDVYYLGGQSLCTSAALKDTYTDIASTNVPGIQVGAQIGSIQEKLAQTNSPEADLVSLPKVTDIISELLTGKMQAAYIESAVAESYAQNYPDLHIICEVPYEDASGSAIGVAKGNEPLLAAINEIIAKALEDGTMNQFVADANEQATGTVYEGLLDAEGNIQ